MDAHAHNVAEGDKGFIQESSGVLFLPLVYLGTKHMVAGYDHLLFLYGVIFLLYRLNAIVALATGAEPSGPTLTVERVKGIEPSS